MTAQSWLDEVQRQLAERGLPPSYIRRFMDELTDHLEDLKKETMRRDKTEDQLSQLGKPEDIAIAAAKAYRETLFFGRHPVIKFSVFAVSPAPIMLFTLVILLYAFKWFFIIGEKSGYYAYVTNCLANLDPSVLHWGTLLMVLTLPMTLLTLLYCGWVKRYYRWAKRSQIGKRWIWISSAMLAIGPILLLLRFNLEGDSAWRLGLGASILSWQFCVQLIGPLIVCLWFMRRTRGHSPDNTESVQAVA